MPSWKVTPPKDDAEYFERLSKAIFSAGLNWKMVDNKWPGFRKAFVGFSPTRVAKFTGKEMGALMTDAGIVRNEKKISATVQNAAMVLAIEKEFGSFKGYLAEMEGRERELQNDLQARFKHVGPSTARTFLWSVGYRLTPTSEEKAWMKGHSG